MTGVLYGLSILPSLLMFCGIVVAIIKLEGFYYSHSHWVFPYEEQK